MVGLESKEEISRPWDILKPKEELEESDQPFFYSFNIKGQAKLLTSCMIATVLVHS